MKRIGLFMCLSALALYSLSSCNDQPDDSVEQAEQLNEQKEETMPGFADENDAEFAVKAAQGGLAEVAFSEVANEKSTTQSVKDFADMMIKDHNGANEQLKSIAATKNITLPTGLSEEHQQKKDNLMKKSGKEFDKAYMDQMVDDHRKTVNLFERAIGSLSDPELDQFARETLPTLKSHLQMCEQIKDNLK